MPEVAFPPPEWLEQNRVALEKYADEQSLFNLPPLLDRAALLWLAGEPLADVFEAWHQAALCLQANVDAHLYRMPPTRFKSRRIEPMEIAILSGNPALMRELAQQVGLSVHPVMAGLADDAMLAEVRTLTGFFERGTTIGDQDLAGLGALAYAGALSAMLQGFDDEARAVLRLFLGEVRAKYAAGSKGAPEALRRYVAQSSILMAWLEGAPDDAAAWLGRLAEADVARRAALTVTEETVAEVLNRTLLSLLGLSVLRNAPVGPMPDQALQDVLSFLGGRAEAPDDPDRRQARLAGLLRHLDPSHATITEGEKP